MFEVNTQIVECGLRYDARLDTFDIKVYGVGWSVTIPKERLREFVRIFPEIYWEGEFLHKVIGRNIRLTLDDEGKILLLHHIKRPIKYVV